jgi:hypothetical protein
VCSDANDKSTRAQAITHVPQDADGGNIEQKYSFTKSSSITFCPAFFDDFEFPNLEDVIAIHETNALLTLDQVDCAERILLHEYMHLPWVDNLVPDVDYIGYAKVAQHSSTGSWQQVASLPDAFAWYALYSYFNNNAGGCARDAWPSGEKKPIVIA